MIDDVNAAVAFYTNYLGFRLEINASPAFQCPEPLRSFVVERFPGEDLRRMSRIANLAIKLI
jgi:catechol 2,3-dioxygenase-like lactoylglutathione lyase family enzyme